jgi:hypothetical protein
VHNTGQDQQIVRRPDLECPAENETENIYSASCAYFAEQQASYKEPTQHEKKIDSGPPEVGPETRQTAQPPRVGRLKRRVPAEHQQDRDSSKKIELNQSSGINGTPRTEGFYHGLRLLNRNHFRSSIFN